MGLAPMWMFEIVTMVAAQVKCRMAALGALRKALGWALEMVLEKACKSDRMRADSLSTEKSYVWTLEKVKASTVKVGEAVSCSVGDGEGHSLCTRVMVLY